MYYGIGESAAKSVWRERSGPVPVITTARDILLRLETLTTQLSTAFIGIDADDVDVTCERALRLIGEALDADRATLLEYTVDEGPGDVVALWVRLGPSPAGEETDRARTQWVNDRLACGERVFWTRATDGGANGDASRRDVMCGAMGIPVSVAGQRVGALSVGRFRDGCIWDDDIVCRVQTLAEILTSAVYRRRQDRTLRLKEAELARLAMQLKSEAIYLREEIETLQGFHEIVGESPVLKEALDRVCEVASTDATVLLVGDTGTGKELFARAVHDRSPRRHRPLIRVNCAALPPTLIESELFGHERGAFTGAVSARQGRFELADRSTIFLDEIGDLPLDLQAKLLRVLQEGEFERVGSSHIRKVDVRVIAATHRDLMAAIESGEFRADLYYRLSVFPIHVPPLRDRLEDIPLLVWCFVHRRQRALHRRITNIPDAVFEVLQRYQWPGNVRELENVVERAMIRSTGDTLVLDANLGQPRPASAKVEGGDTLQAFERRHIEHVLRRCGWRINGKGNAAEQLNLHPNTLRFRMKKLGITRPASPAHGGDGGGTAMRRTGVDL